MSTGQVIYVGGAHCSETGGITGSAGDSTGQEVSSKGYNGVAGVKASFSGYYVFRPQDPDSASRMAQIMNTACNNNNIGYSQGSRTGIFKYNADSSVPVNCDCSTLVTYCTNLGGGSQLEQSNTTSSLVNGGLANTGLFFKAIPISQVDELYNGDILIKNGHTEMVCGGSPREGMQDEIVTATWTMEEILNGTSYSGNGALVKQYTNTYGETFEFTPRLAKPFSSHSMTAAQEEELHKWYWTLLYPDMMRKYAWGRFSEIMKSKANFSRADATQWYVLPEDGYSRGTAPQVGALACWTHGYMSGALLAIVESIGYSKYSDAPTGSENVFASMFEDGKSHPYILVSFMSDGTGEFYTRRIYKYVDGSWDLHEAGSDYESGRASHRFQGFIYNPGVANVTGVPSNVTMIDPTSVSGTDSLGGFISGQGGGMIASSWSALQAFIVTAKEHVGDDGSFVKEVTGVNTDSAAWAAAFVVACSKIAGSSLNIVIPNSFSCSDFGGTGVNRNMGTWFDGPALGGNPPVQPGDLALFRTDGNTKKEKYKADKVGIVTEVNGQGINVSFNLSDLGQGTNQSDGISFTVVIGDVEGKVAELNYTTTSKILSGIFRPYWEQIDGTSQSVQQYYSREGMYTEGTSREDLCIRDLRWVTLGDSGFEPSIQGKGMLLCAVNYTGMLANLYSSLAEVGSSAATNADLVVDFWTNSVPSEFQEAQNNQSNGTSGSAESLLPGEMSSGDITNPMSPDNSSKEVSGGYSVSGNSVTVSAYRQDTGKTVTTTITLDGTMQAIYKCLMGYLNNPAACIGVMGNMWQESKFKTSSYLAQDWTLNYKADGGGLIGWTNTKYEQLFTKMVNYCSSNGGNWKNNLEGQIGFIFYYAGMSEKGTTGNNIYANKWAAAGVTKLRGVTNNMSGAMNAAKIFYSHWEVGEGNAKKFESGQGTARVTAEYSVRASWAAGIWKLFFGGK